MSGRRRRLPLLRAASFVAAALLSMAAHVDAPAAGASAADGSAATTSADDALLAAASGVRPHPPIALRHPGEIGLVIGHRGDPAAAPENTLPAIESATGGADMLEIDIRLSKDGVPVVIHDAEVGRTTDGEGLVAELTADELRTLDAGAWFSPSFSGTAIPTLAEVLAALDADGPALLVEFKGRWSDAEVAVALDLLAVAGVDVVAQSFSATTVSRIAEAAPRLPVGWLVHEIDAAVIAEALSIGADAVNPAAAEADGVALAHDAGLAVLVWTPDAVADWAGLTALGVDGIITNRPEALSTWMRNHVRGAGPTAEAPGAA